MNYLLVLPVPFHRVGHKTIACESAFAEHLKHLRSTSAKHFTEMVIIAPQMSIDFFQENENNLGRIEESAEGIRLVSIQPTGTSFLRFWLLWSLRVFYRIFFQVRQARIIHAGLSMPITIPTEIFAILMGVILKRKTLFVVDIDERQSAKMAYKTGRLSRKSYFLRKYLYDPLMNLQIAFGARFCSLALFKSGSLVKDFGRGRSSVKNFLDTAYPKDLVLSDSAVQAKKYHLNNHDTLELVYFGRLVSYKGIDHMIQALAIAQHTHNAKVHFTIIGGGDQLDHLKRQVIEHNVASSVTFIESLPYGKPLFEKLSNKELLLAAPQTEDTPRSVFDAMALGIPTLGYDTYYYRDLSSTGAVDTIPWLNINKMGERIAEYAKDKNQLSKMIDHAIVFARNNSQEQWMEKRDQWMQTFLDV